MVNTLGDNAFVRRAEKGPLWGFAFTDNDQYPSLFDREWQMIGPSKSGKFAHSKCRTRVAFDQLGYNPCAFPRHFEMLMYFNPHTFRTLLHSKSEPHRSCSKPLDFLRTSQLSQFVQFHPIRMIESFHSLSYPYLYYYISIFSLLFCSLLNL